MAGQNYTWTAVPHGGNPASGADFNGGNFPSGAGTVSTFHNSLLTSGIFTTEIIADNTTEGTEQYRVELSDQNGNVVATKVINVTDDSQAPVGQVFWFHLGGGVGANDYPFEQDLIGGATLYLSDNNPSTSNPLFEDVFADMIANPSSYQTVSSQAGINSGDQFVFPVSNSANFYWIAIPDSLGVPDLTQNARLADTNNNINDVAGGKLAFNFNGDPYVLYRVNLAAAAGGVTIQYNV